MRTFYFGLKQEEIHEENSGRTQESRRFYLGRLRTTLLVQKFSLKIGIRFEFVGFPPRANFSTRLQIKIFYSIKYLQYIKFI